jgi:hydroxyacylglutathione hydrolase
MMKKPYDYIVKKIGEGIYLINERLSTMYIIEGTEKALVIDCGTGVGDFKALIESLTPLPYDLVATHAHVDHIGGRGQFSDIYISATDAKKIKSVNTLYRKFYYFLNKKTNPGVYSNDSVSIKRTETEPKVHIIKEGDSFDLGGGRVVEVFETPGHTKGSISLLLKNEKMLFAGDVANSYLFMFLSNTTNIDTLVNTLNKLYSIEGYDSFWPSHVENCAPKDDILKVRDAALELQKKKNTILPCIKTFKYNDVQIIYRTNNIH